MALAHAALTLVLDRERHAYEIGTLLNQLVPGPRHNSGQIHALMTQLEDQGHVTARWVSFGARRKRLYRITAQGRHEWARWRARPLPEPRSPRDEVLIKTMVLGIDEPTLLRVILDDYRAQLVQELDQLDESMVNPAECETRTDVLHTLARLRECLHQQMELRWTVQFLDEIERLTTMAASPAGPRSARAALLVAVRPGTAAEPTGTSRCGASNTVPYEGGAAQRPAP